MDTQSIKVALSVLLKDFSNANNNVSDVPQNSNADQSNCKYFDGILVDVKIVEKGLNEYIKTFSNRNQGSKFDGIIFKSIKVILSNTTQSQRLHHLRNILKEFYDEINKTLIELNRLNDIISIEQFNDIVWEMIPMVKYTLINESASDNKANVKNIKELAQELNEFIKFPILSIEDCYEIISNKLQDLEDLDLISYTTTPTQNSGLLGEYYKLKINLKNNTQIQSHHFFIKYLLKDFKSLRQYLAEMTFQKEEQFYMEFIPLLKQLGYDDILNFAPKCYYSKKNVCLVLEDVTQKGYQEAAQKAQLTYEQLSQAFRQLARVHASGILFEEKLSQLLGKEVRLDRYFAEMMTERIAVSEEPLKAIFENGAEATSYMMEKFADEFGEVSLEEFQRYAKEAVKSLYEVVKPARDRRNFLCHGDLWSNNMLFKENSECLLIDFQIIRYCTPLMDVMFLLTLNTEKKFRDEFREVLLNEYYANLRDILSEYDVDLNTIMSKKQFLEDVDKVTPAIIGKSLHYMPFILLPKEVQGEMFIGKRCKIIEEYWDKVNISRYRELLEDLYVAFTKSQSVINQIEM